MRTSTELLSVMAVVLLALVVYLWLALRRANRRNMALHKEIEAHRSEERQFLESMEESAGVLTELACTWDPRWEEWRLWHGPGPLGLSWYVGRCRRFADRCLREGKPAEYADSFLRKVFLGVILRSPHDQDQLVKLLSAEESARWLEKNPPQEEQQHKM